MMLSLLVEYTQLKYSGLIDVLSVLKESHCGWWVEATPEKLAEVLMEVLFLDDRTRDEYAKRARKLVMEKFSWTSSADSIIKFYEKIIRI